MAEIYVDRDEATGEITVTVCRGMSVPKITRHTDRKKAEAYANSKMGARSGMILSTLDMTPEQLAAHRERQARAEAMMSGALAAANENQGKTEATY